MHTVVIVVHLMLVLAMIGVIMLQKSEGGGLGIGSTGGFMSSRGTANVLTRATAILAAGFFLTSLVLSIIASHGRRPTTVVPAPASQSGAPATPAAPASPGGGVLDQLQRGAPQAPQSK
jgi:preprotein translocase subunit SecG